MKTILIFVSSLDGKITKWNDLMVRKWSSDSDKEYFNKVWRASRLIVMGINSFKAEPVKVSEKQLLVVMTHRLSDYNSYRVKGQIEFTDESPAELSSRFEKQGFEQMLVAGGPHIATSFLKEQLVDELWLTTEPKIFGTGANFVTGEELDIDLELIGFEKVNEQGTLITKYKILKK